MNKKENAKNEAIKIIEQVKTMAEQQVTKAITSGALDFEDEGFNEIELGRIIAKGCLNSAIYNITLDQKQEDEVKNLNCFI